MRWILQKLNSKRRKGKDTVISLTRIIAVAMAITLLPVPAKVSAIEEGEVQGEEAELTSDAGSKKSEALEETEKETSIKEKTESASDDNIKESDSLKETESAEETSAEKETLAQKETESASDTGTKETKAPKETQQETETPSKEETKPVSDTVPKETESPKKTETEETTSKEENVSKEKVSDSEKTIKVETPSAVEIMVPIYNYDVVNIVVPAKYAVALNPYELAVKTGEDEASTDQVVSRKYGILNKSSTDKIVRITLEVEDLNEGKIVFVDSPEEAQDADADTYAVYLAAVPADDSGVWIDGENADCSTTAAELSDVEMNGATDSALALKEGKNTLSFMLSKAVYDFEEGSELILDEDELIIDEDELLLDEDESELITDEEERRQEGILKLLSLDPGEGSITAFTFTGVMNPRADWGKLLYGIKISAVYTYETATGKEVIVEGTGAMIET